MRRRGVANPYNNGVWRKAWADESARREAAAEKHSRGDIARAARAVRVEERGYV